MEVAFDIVYHSTRPNQLGDAAPAGAPDKVGEADPVEVLERLMASRGKFRRAVGEARG